MDVTYLWPPWMTGSSHPRCRQYPGSQGYEEVDAQTFADWGADFAKLDSCSGSLPNGTESWYQQYGRWSAAMNKTGRPMVCSPPLPSVRKIPSWPRSWVNCSLF